MATMSAVRSALAQRAKRSVNFKIQISLLAAAVVIFAFYYFDTYQRAMVPDSLHEFMNVWFKLKSVNEILIWIMAALGLNIVVGYAGLLDLGFVAFWAIGGYAAGWLMSDFIHQVRFRFFTTDYVTKNDIPGVHINFWPVLIAGAILCAIFGVIIGAPTLRLRSDYLALVTLGFGQIIPEFFFNAGDIHIGNSHYNLTNGNQGINPVDSVNSLNFTSDGALTVKDVGPFDLLPKYAIFLVLVAVIMFMSVRLREGKLGRAWLAIREDELAASAMGVPLMRTKLASYSIGAVAGGIAGVAYALHINTVLPDAFDFSKSITLLAMVVLGGMGNVWGVTIGAIVLAWINNTGLEAGGEAINSAFGTQINFKNFIFIIFGGILVLMMLFRREGFLPEARTRLVLREPGRTEAESLHVDMEEAAPELEALPEPSLHGHTVPTARTGESMEGKS